MILRHHLKSLDLVGGVSKKSVEDEQKDQVDKKNTIASKHHSMPDRALKALTKLMLAKNKKSTDSKQANKREASVTSTKQQTMSDNAFIALTKLLSANDIVDKKSVNYKQAKKESAVDAKKETMSKASSVKLVKLLYEKGEKKRDLQEKETQKSVDALNQQVSSDPAQFSSLSDEALDHLINALTGKQQQQQKQSKKNDDADRKEIGEIMKLLKTDPTTKGIFVFYVF